MKAMILSAGFGTRLAPLSNELPKPLVWVGDRPAIAHIAEKLVAAGIEDIVLNTHHRREAFSKEMLARIPGRLSIVTEETILGTGGGLANAAGILGGGDVVVWNGDILAPIDVTGLLAAHRGHSGEGQSGRPGERQSVGSGEGQSGRRGEGQSAGSGGGQSAGRGWAATLAIAPRGRGEGTVGVGASGEVVRLRGEWFGDELSSGDFLGISVVGEELRGRLPIPGCLVGEGFLPWLRAGGRIGTLTVDVSWEDIGSVSAYLRANARWLSDSGRGSHVGPGARVSPGIELRGSVVGEGAEIEGEGVVEGCVIWPGARATGPLTRAVVTTAGLLVRV